MTIKVPEERFYPDRTNFNQNKGRAWQNQYFCKGTSLNKRWSYQHLIKNFA